MNLGPNNNRYDSPEWLRVYQILRARIGIGVKLLAMFDGRETDSEQQYFVAVHTGTEYASFCVLDGRNGHEGLHAVEWGRYGYLTGDEAALHAYNRAHEALMLVG